MSIVSLSCLAPNISLSFNNYHISPSSMSNLDDSYISPTEEDIVYAETLLPNYVITASGILPNELSNLEKLLYTTNNFFYNFASMVSSSAQKKQFRNTATDHKTLKSHAKVQSKKFRDLCKQIVLVTQEPGVKVNFGQNDKFITKTEKSLRNKITQDAKINNISLEEATSQISDALRGTITVQTKRAMESVAQRINETAKLYNCKVLWKNFYNNPTDKGYVGLHAKILLPFRNRHGKICQIVTELQVHDE